MTSRLPIAVQPGMVVTGIEPSIVPGPLSASPLKIRFLPPSRPVPVGGVGVGRWVGVLVGRAWVGALVGTGVLPETPAWLAHPASSSAKAATAPRSSLPTRLEPKNGFIIFAYFLENWRSRSG